VNKKLTEKELMLKVSAHDVVVTRDAIPNSSFQNSFTGKLTNVKTRSSDVLLTLNAHGHSLHAIVSIRAQRQLTFKVGDSVFAYVKAMSLAFDEYR
jgi:molybdopterin-binding protein